MDASLVLLRRRLRAASKFSIIQTTRKEQNCSRSDTRMDRDLAWSAASRSRNRSSRHSVIADGRSQRMTLLKWAVIFALVSVVAAILGFTGISAASADVARILFFVFLVIFLVLLVLGLTASRT